MHFFKSFAGLILTFVGINANLSAARYQSYVNPQQEIALNETRDGIENLHRQLANQQTELQTYEQKLDNLDTILDTLRDQVQQNGTQYKEQLKGNTNTLEMKLAAFENTIKSLTSDLKQLQTHANDTSSALKTFKQKFSDWDDRLKLQNQNIETLQSALQTVLEALQIKVEGSSNGSTSTYRIKSGDSLEKIAKLHGTSVQKLKELNGINSDKIVEGKVLKIN